MTIRFSNQIVAELIQPFWAAWQGGEFMTDASAIAGTHRNRGLAWVRQSGGVRPRRGRGLQGRYLSFGEREEIALGRAGGESIRSIAGRLGRSPSTISRELARNSDGRGAYRATTAHPLAYERASRPKPAKLVTNLALRARVELDLEKKYSPEQIAGRLRGDHPDDPEMWVSTETIYQAAKTWTGSPPSSTTDHANDQRSRSRSNRSDRFCCVDRLDPPSLADADAECRRTCRCVPVVVR
jgi:transposase, IS30 family